MIDHNKLTNAYKNTDGNSEFHISKLNPWKLAFWKETIIAEDEVKASVILAKRTRSKPSVSSFRSFSFLPPLYGTEAPTRGNLWRKVFFKNFTKFTEKHLCWSEACNFIKKETLAHAFSYEFWKNSKNTSEWLLSTITRLL